MGKKIISFCLWGNIPKYTTGAIRNAEMAKDLFSDWICRYHVSDNVNNGIVDKLKSMDNTEVIIIPDDNWNGALWRFYPAGEEDVDIMISRDVDSRLTIREKTGVYEWLASDKNFHIIRDHPHHMYKILAGMWGVRNHILLDIKEHIDAYQKNKNRKETDQDFLRDIIYPMIKDNCFIHSEFYTYGDEIVHTINYERKNFEFIGEYIDENEIPSNYHRQELRNNYKMNYI